jgi:hypothetical protein
MRLIEAQRDERAQMLLATGMVLLLSLMSMAIFSIKVAGMSMPHEPASDGALVTTAQVTEALPSLVHARAAMWMEEGDLDAEEAVTLALDSVTRDLLHHGEVRGVEVKLMNTVVTLDASSTDVVHVEASLGVSDTDVRIEVPVTFNLNFA